MEFVEALTVVLAVGAAQGWPTALAGAASGVAVLAITVIVAGPSLSGLHLAWLRLPVGLLVLVLGLRWLGKAVGRLRASLKTGSSRQGGAEAGSRDAVPRAIRNVRLGVATGFAVAFQVVLVEGGEVAVIVLAVAAGGAGLLPAASGAALALMAVIALGVLLRRPLLRIPENTLKAAAGVLLTAFGTVWTGEGIGGAWPGGAASLTMATLFWASVAGLLARLPGGRPLPAGFRACWPAGLAWVAACAWARRLGLPPCWAALLLLPGLAASVAAGVLAAGPVRRAG